MTGINERVKVTVLDFLRKVKFCKFSLGFSETIPYIFNGWVKVTVLDF